MPPTIREIMGRIPNAFLSDRAEGIDAVVHFKFTGAESGEWNAVIRGGECHVAPGIPRSRPTITVVADSTDFIQIVSGELDGTNAFMDGRLKVTGDILLAPKLIRLFRVP